MVVVGDVEVDVEAPVWVESDAGEGKITGPIKSIKLVVAAKAWNVELKKQVFPSLYNPAGFAVGPPEWPF